MENCNVNILGTEYRIECKEMKDAEVDGYCDYTSKHIVIRSDNANRLEDFERLQKKQLRHEIIHAFMSESGLQANWQHSIEFGHEETTVDWFSIQAPKIYKVFMELGILDVTHDKKTDCNGCFGASENLCEKCREDKQHRSIPDLMDLSGTIALSKGTTANTKPTEFVAMIHAEVSEVLEEFRAGHKATETYYSDDGKPEGVPSEIADVVIYCFIMSHLYGIDLEKAITEKLEYNKTRPYKHGKAF